jgi:hypothetical protein
MVDVTYHQVQTERVVPHSHTSLLSQGGLDLESTGGQDNGERQPETTVGRKSSSTESVTNSHFPGSVSKLDCRGKGMKLRRLTSSDWGLS